MDIKAEINRIKELGNGYYFIQEMQNLSEQAASGNGDSIKILESMIGECKESSYWKENCRYCSAVINALAHSRTSNSLKIFMKFIEELPEDMPYGAVDLIGGLLPVYKKIILATVKDMAHQSDHKARRAIGMFALSNMALDDDLEESEMRFLLDLLKNFEGDMYYSENFADIAKSYLSARIKEYENQDDILDNILIGV